MTKVSIIVPIYNQENYLRECIESLINQTYTDIEILLIDDGSTDNSLKICKEYQKKDKRIKVITKENGGLSSTRNVGLDHVTGDFIMFCDSDDFFAPNTVEKMEKTITKYNDDYSVGNYINCDDDSTLWKKPVFDKKLYPSFELSIKDYDKSFYIMSSSVCNKIFRRSFIEDLNLRFVEGVPAEDAIFTTYCFMKSTSVHYISDIIYMYRQRSAGTSISTNNNIKYFKGISEAYYMIYRNFKENNEMTFYQYFYLKTLFYIMYKFIDSTFMTYQEKLDVLEELRWFCRLSIELNIKYSADNEFFKIVQNINHKKYKKAIEACQIMAFVRKEMSEEDKLKMSKIPPTEYPKYIIREVSYEEDSINS